MTEMGAKPSYAAAQANVRFLDLVSRNQTGGNPPAPDVEHPLRRCREADILSVCEGSKDPSAM